jgi:hypothetical protein
MVMTSTTGTISCASREAAMNLVRAFATVHHVDVWLSDGGSYELVVGARTRRKAARGAKPLAPSMTARFDPISRVPHAIPLSER